MTNCFYLRMGSMAKNCSKLVSTFILNRIAGSAQYVTPSPVVLYVRIEVQRGTCEQVNR